MSSWFLNIPKAFRRGGAAMLLAVVIACSVGVGAAPAGQSAPTADVDGRELMLRAKATRSMLFGTVDLYSVGIYLPRDVDGVPQLRDQHLAKAVRLAVLYDGGMPGSIPASWWDELVPALTKEEQHKLRRAFRRLSGGEDVWITYTLQAGTRIEHGGKVVVSSAGDQLMNAVLDLWLGPTPVSQAVHDSLVDGLRDSRR